MEVTENGSRRAINGMESFVYLRQFFSSRSRRLLERNGQTLKLLFFFSVINFAENEEKKASFFAALALVHASCPIMMALPLHFVSQLKRKIFEDQQGILSLRLPLIGAMLAFVIAISGSTFFLLAFVFSRFNPGAFTNEFLFFGGWMMLLRAVEAVNKLLGGIVSYSVSVALYVDKLFYMIAFCSCVFAFSFWARLGNFSFLFASLVLEAFVFFGQVLVISMYSRMTFSLRTRPKEFVLVFAAETKLFLSDLSQKLYKFCYLDYLCLVLLFNDLREDACLLSVWLRLLELMHHTGKVFASFLCEKVEQLDSFGLVKQLDQETKKGFKALAYISLVFTVAFFLLSMGISSLFFSKRATIARLSFVIKASSLVAYSRLVRPVFRRLLPVMGKADWIWLISVPLYGAIVAILAFLFRGAGFGAMASIVVLADVVETMFLFRAYYFSFILKNFLRMDEYAGFELV